MRSINRHVNLIFRMGERFLNGELAGSDISGRTAPLPELRDGEARNPAALATKPLHQLFFCSRRNTVEKVQCGFYSEMTVRHFYETLSERRPMEGDVSTRAREIRPMKGAFTDGYRLRSMPTPVIP